MGRIRTSFDVVTEESAAEGDVAESGWVDEDGEVLGVTAAIEWLRSKGPLEPSSSQFHKGIWYSGPSEQDMHTGEWYQESYHLAGFTEDQQQRIYSALFSRRSRTNPRRCDCENEACRAGHRMGSCPHDGTVKAMYGSLCSTCAQYMPKEFLGRRNPHEQYYGDEEAPEDAERMRRLKAISDAAMGGRKNPGRGRVVFKVTSEDRYGDEHVWAVVYAVSEQRYDVWFTGYHGDMRRIFESLAKARAFAKEAAADSGWEP